MKADSTRAPDGATTLTTKEAWETAFAAWEAAKVAADDAHAAHATGCDEAGALSASDPDAPAAIKRLAALAESTGSAQAETFKAAILTPAPDFAAVLWKMTALYGEGDTGPDDEHSAAWRMEYPGAVIADLERLQSDFAAAWLKSWVKDGGSVVIDTDGKAQVGWVVYDLSPAFVEPHPTWPNEVRETNALFNTAHHDATMKARYEALHMVPGGANMVKAHMRAEGIRVAVYNREQDQ
ncbi:hypothetical protein V6U71_05935 [Sphingopyxis sp. J-6]|uniref:hypothetical protein n=1 Tax=Sphingopyxis sp. J-6 TaxID=3122054 RepID=UPI0039841121